MKDTHSEKVKKALIRAFVFVLAGVLATLFVVYISGHEIAKRKGGSEDLSKSFPELAEIDRAVNSDYLLGFDRKKSADKMYEAYVSSLGDGYSVYLPADEAAAWKDAVNGGYTGIGIKVSFGKEAVITSVDEGSPADAAGLAKGDAVESVDGRSFGSEKDLAEYLGSKAGRSVDLVYVRDGAKKNAEITVSDVESEQITWEMTGDTGLIKIRSFDDDAVDAFSRAVAGINSKGASGLVLDLRDNGGGYFESGVEIADIILPECTIAHTETRDGKKEYYNSDSDSIDMEIAVLVNGDTASTAELVAAAISENGAGKLIGEKTYGKGLVQKEYDLSSGAVLKLSVMQIFTPNGKKIEGSGVEPDIEIKGDKKQLGRALKELKR